MVDEKMLGEILSGDGREAAYDIKVEVSAVLG